MRLIWAPEALQDRLSVYRYIAKANPQAALKIDAMFERGAERLTRHPELGRRSRVAGSRELVVHSNYFLVYEIASDAIHITAVVHTARQWPPLI
jgi:addiction module RelE/StbE family toxin